MQKVLDCAIIGAGPAGLLSALYLRRYRREIIVFNAGKPRASWIPKIHNLLGLDHSISGRVALKRLHHQLRKLDTPFISEKVLVKRKTHWLIRRKK